MSSGNWDESAGESRLALLAALRPRDLVGRTRELEQLRSTWTTVRGGLPAITLLAGPAGAGKTRLAAEVAGEIDQAGALVAYVACRRELTPPNQPWLDLVTQLAQQIPGDMAKRVGSLHDLVAVAPDLASVVGLATTRTESSLADDAEVRARRIRVAIGDVLQAMARRVPVLAVIDDLHWAGPQTLATLGHLTERAPTEPLWVLGTFRDTDFDMSAHLDLLLADLGRVDWSDRLTLRGLSRPEVEELLTNLVGAVVSSAKLTSYAEQVTERTDGNPFLVTELGRDLALGARSVVPDSVVEVVRQRQQRLSPTARKILDTVAVAEVIDLPTLRAVVGPEQAGLGLREALGSGLITELEHLLPRYQFSHALLQDAVASQLDGLGRAEIHLGLAEALEETAGDHATALASLARHFAGAVSLIGPAKAIDYGRRTAALARSNAGYREAVEALTLIAEILPTGSDRRVELLIEAVSLRTRDGSDLTQALEAAHETLSEAHESGNPLLVAEAAIGFERLAQHLVGLPNEAHGALQLAIEAGGDRLDETTLVRLRASLARAKMLLGDPQGVELAQQAVAAARRLDERTALAHTLEAATHNIEDPRARLAVSLECARPVRRRVAADVGDRQRDVGLFPAWRHRRGGGHPPPPHGILRNLSVLDVPLSRARGQRRLGLGPGAPRPSRRAH